MRRVAVVAVCLIVCVFLLMSIRDPIDRTLEQMHEDSHVGAFPTFSEALPGEEVYRDPETPVVGLPMDPITPSPGLPSKPSPGKSPSAPSVQKPASPSSIPPKSPSASSTQVAVPAPVSSFGKSAEDIALEAAVKRYSDIHAQQMRAFEQDPSQGKFVIMWLFGGLGNRLLPSMTGFLMGLLTDRALLVNWKPNESSKRLYEMFDMRAFNWDLQSFPQILQRYNEDYCKTYPHNVFYIPEGDDIFASFREELMCTDIVRDWEPYSVVSQTSCQYTLPYLLHNPHLQEKLKLWGLDGLSENDVWGRLSTFLFKPASFIQQHVDTFIDKHFSVERPRIGVQSRINNPFIHVDQEAVLRCVRQIEGKFPTPPDIFLATDNEGFRAKMKQIYGDRLIYNPLPLGEYAKEYNQHNGLIDAILLSLSDRILTTSMSTYGYLARGWHGVNEQRDDVWLMRDNECLQLETSQPCLQFCDSKEQYQVQGASCYSKIKSSLSDYVDWQVTVPGPAC